MTAPTPTLDDAGVDAATAAADGAAADRAAEADADRRLVIAGAVAIAGAVLAALARKLGLLAPGWTIAVVLGAGSVTLSFLVRYLGRRATEVARARTAARIATVGLVLSGTSVVLALPTLTRIGGWATFAADVGALLVAAAVLFVLATPGRTLGWRVFVGMAILGFLVVPSLARTVGEPFLARFGESNPLGHSLWIPVTENLLLALPCVLVALTASRRSLRPAALDVMLIGAWVGVGFALAEDASYGRGGPNWSIAAPLSWLFPTGHGGSALGTWWFGAGHLVSAAAIGVGVGITVLYRRRYRWAVLAAPVMFVVTTAEHGMNNLLASGSHSVVITILRVLTLAGTLSSLLLLGAAGWLAQVERSEPWRAAVRHGLFLRPTIAAERMRELGTRQLPEEQPEAGATEAGATEAPTAEALTGRS